MEPVHDVQSPAQPIPTGTQSPYHSRSDIDAEGKGDTDPCVNRRWTGGKCVNTGFDGLAGRLSRDSGQRNNRHDDGAAGVSCHELET
jgi:hypothetical protein